MNKIFKKILKNNSGGATIMITIMIMATILTVALSLGNVVINGLKVSANQANATQAYFTAETAAERFLWEIRKNNFDPGASGCLDTGEYIYDDFSGCNAILNNSTIFDLPNGSSFFIYYTVNTPTTTITNFGEYKKTRRVVQLEY